MQNAFHRRAQTAPALGCWAALGGALLVSGALVPQLAQAGQWKVSSMTATRSGTSYTWNSTRLAMEERPMPAGMIYTDRDITTQPLSSSANAWTAKAYKGQTATASQDFDVKVKIVWVPDSGKTLAQDPPDNKASLLVSSTASASMSSPGKVTYKLNNGLGSPTTQPWFIPAFESRGDNILVPVDVSSGKGEASFLIHAEGGAPAGQTGAESGVALRADFGATPDTRSVKLTRNGQDRSELKDGSWVTYGDTLYSWVKQFSNGDSSPARNFQSFHTEYNGNWSSDYALPGVYWNWVPDGSFETRAATPGDPSSTSYDKYNSSWIMATGTAYEEPPLLGVGQTAWSDKTDPAKEVTLKYFARDTDGAQAQATYKLTLHNPVEKVGLDDTIKWAESAFLQSDGTYLLHTGEPCTIGEKKVAIGSTSTRGFFLGSSLSGFLPFLEMLGISATYSSSHSSSVTETLELKTSLTTNQYVFAIARDNYIRHHSKFYAFDVNGRVKRIVTKNGDGTPLTGPMECYHEACVDDYQNTQCRWSTPYPLTNGGAAATFTAANNTIKDPSFDYS